MVSWLKRSLWRSAVCWRWRASVKKSCAWNAGAGTLGVEVGQKRVLGFVEHDRRVEARAEPIGERRLADAHRAFDRDVAEVQGAASIAGQKCPLRRSGRRAQRRSLAIALSRANRADRAAAAAPSAGPLLRDELRPHRRPAFVLVTVEENGAAGVGECVADANPFYSSETTRTAWHII